MFLSIIIPIYNAKKHLRECLDSYLRQNISPNEYEILCVNDGSTDGSAEILNDYEQKFSNVKVIHKENEGVSSARNTGIEAAQGDYIWFIDADDFIQENVLAKIKNIYLDQKFEQLVFRYYEFVDKLSPQELLLKEENSLCSDNRYAGHIVWDFIVNRSIILNNNIRFNPHIYYGEDTMFAYKVNKLEIFTVEIEDIIYFYRRNSASATYNNSPEALNKRLVSNYMIANEIYQNKVFPQSDAEINFLMSAVRFITIHAALFPPEKRKTTISQLKKDGLFPIFPYRNIKEWSTLLSEKLKECKGGKSYLLTLLRFFSTTRIGFSMLCGLHSVLKLKNSLISLFRH